MQAFYYFYVLALLNIFLAVDLIQCYKYSDNWTVINASKWCFFSDGLCLKVSPLLEILWHHVKDLAQRGWKMIVNVP